MATVFVLFVFFLTIYFIVFFFKQKTAYEMRISDWSSDVCSSDLAQGRLGRDAAVGAEPASRTRNGGRTRDLGQRRTAAGGRRRGPRRRRQLPGALPEIGRAHV